MPRPHSPVPGVVALLLVAALGIMAGTPVLAGEPRAGTRTASPVPTAAVPAVEDDTATEAVQAWIDGEGDELVAARIGGQASVGPLVRLRTWAPGFLDGTEPDAAPVQSLSWMAVVDVEHQPTALLVVTADGDGAEGILLEDAELAGAVTSVVPVASLVRDETGLPQGEAAWYAVANGTVTALNDQAASLLAGPVPLSVYSVAVRERIAQGSASPAPAAASAGDDGSMWTTVGVAVLIGVLVLAVTVRHERRVLAPLREGMDRSDRGGATPLDDDASPGPAQVGTGLSGTDSPA